MNSGLVAPENSDLERNSSADVSPLTTWFWAAYVMATQPNGISALQLQRELSLGSYKTAWLLCTKLRRAMVSPGRNPLSGFVEIDKTAIPCGSKSDRAPGGDSSGDGKV